MQTIMEEYGTMELLELAVINRCKQLRRNRGFIWSGLTSKPTRLMFSIPTWFANIFNIIEHLNFTNM